MWIDESADEDSQLYGLFKQGTQDPPFEKTTAPGMFEMKVRLVLLPFLRFAPRNTKDVEWIEASDIWKKLRMKDVGC